MSNPSPTLPHDTANVVVQNPAVRRVIGNTLAVAVVLLGIATLVDTSIPNLDYAFITTPATAIIAGLFGIFQLGVTSPNVPRA